MDNAHENIIFQNLGLVHTIFPSPKEASKMKQLMSPVPYAPPENVWGEDHNLFHCEFFRNQREKLIPLDLIKQPQVESVGKLFEGNT